MMRYFNSVHNFVNRLASFNSYKIVLNIEFNQIFLFLVI